jgi:hypothetical protein
MAIHSTGRGPIRPVDPDGTLKIIDIHKRHTGANAATPWKSSEVREMVDAANRDKKVSWTERKHLLSTLYVFGGGYSGKNDKFENPAADKALLAKTVMSGMETAKKFDKLPAADRAAFLSDVRSPQIGSRVGMTTRQMNVYGDDDFDPRFFGAGTNALKSAFNKQLVDLDKRRPINRAESYARISVIERNGEAYGYILTTSAPTRDGKGSFSVTQAMDRNGQPLKVLDNAGWEPYL